MPTLTRRSNRDLLSIIALAAVYTAVGILELSLPETSVELRRMIWLPSGVGLAWLIIGGARLWPGIAVGAMLTTVLTGGSLLHVVGTGIANPVEALIAVWILMTGRAV